jgi:hypothetical protein
VGRPRQQVQRNLHGGVPGATQTVTLTPDDVSGYNFVGVVSIDRPTGAVTITRIPRDPIVTARWIVGLVEREMLANAGIVHADTTYAYDDSGRRTSRTRVVQDRGGANPKPSVSESWTYDVYGNLRSYTDAGGAGRTEYYCYDGDSAFEAGGGCYGGASATHSVRTATRDRLEQVTRYERELATGSVLAQTREWSGDLIEAERDRFDRLLSVSFTPAGGAATLLETRSYSDGGATARAARERVRQIGNGGTVRSAEYLDGFGQVVRAVHDGRSGYIGVATRYDYAGRETFVSYDRPCVAGDCEEILTGTPPGTAIAYL